jgi:ureidoacrylate peracid hydrolase
MTHTLSREVPIEPAHAALLFVDVQNYNCTWEGGEYAHLNAAEKEERYAYFFRTLQQSALPNMVRLQQACRCGGIEVTYTIVESLTSDGRDRSLDYKITGFHVPKGSPDAKMLDELAPRTMKSCFPRRPHRYSSRPTSITYCVISAPNT